MTKNKEEELEEKKLVKSPKKLEKNKSQEKITVEWIIK